MILLITIILDYAHTVTQDRFYEAVSKVIIGRNRVIVWLKFNFYLKLMRKDSGQCHWDEGGKASPPNS